MFAKQIDMKFENAIDRAIKNIIHYGDTDIFPFPFERLLFDEKRDECKDILTHIHNTFDKYIEDNPPLTITKISQAGYFGFRNATQIEPFWNAYYLSCVIALADKIELARISKTENKVYSYRVKWQKDKSSLFEDLSWNDYRQMCLINSKTSSYVIQTDISDFYARINHHKLENELQRVAPGNRLIKRIMALLGSFSSGYSYGLPIGGPASRILSELSLNHVDKHLNSRNVTFCRYADDFTIFCKTKSEAYNYLILLAEKLSNEGLSLQKTKTKIISAKEFEEMHTLLDPVVNDEAGEEQKLLNISIRFDPYSSNAVEDYENLKEEINKIDIVNILSKEVHKTRIDQTVTKQAITAIKALNHDLQLKAVRILLDSENLISLSPVFTTTMRAVRSIYHDLKDDAKDLIDESLLGLFSGESHLVKIALNLNYIVQVFSLRKSKEKETLLIKLFETHDDHLLRRQIIIILANWNCEYWLSDIRKKFTTLSRWERRSFIYASFFLGDEGRHWREKNKGTFDKIEQTVQIWASQRFAKKNYIFT